MTFEDCAAAASASSLLICTRCGERISNGLYYSDGDGTGQRFVHARCYHARCYEENINPPGELRLYTAFVAVEYDFQVMARSEAEALELAKQNWLQSRANVAIAHAEVELAPALEQALGTGEEVDKLA